MKTKCIILTILFWFVSSAHAIQIEAVAKYPVVLGAHAQGFNSTIGGGASIYFEPFIDPAIPNYIHVGYQTYKLRADAGASSLRVIPVLFGIELPGKVFKDFNSTLGFAGGIAPNYVSVPTITSYNWSMAFALQVKPGLEYVASEGFSIVAHMPYTVFLTRASLSSIDFDAGIKIKL